MRDPREDPGTQTSLVPFEQPVNAGQAALWAFMEQLQSSQHYVWRVARGVQRGVSSAPSPQGSGSTASEIGCTRKEKQIWHLGEWNLVELHFPGARF